MKFNEALGAVIREERIAQGRTLKKISERGALSVGYLCDIERGTKEPSSQIIEAIAYGLDLKPHELIIDAGIKMYREAAPEVLYPPENFEWLDLVK